MDLIRRAADAPVNERGGGQVSRLLSSGGAVESMAVTWVDAEPGSEQELHAHEASEQVYVIVAGTGVMTLGEEAHNVGPGDLVTIPASTLHAIRATTPLTYVSATTPPFPAHVDGDRWEPR